MFEQKHSMKGGFSGFPGLISLLFVVLVTLSGCSSFEASVSLWVDESTIPVVADIDFSYPVSGNVSEQGTIVYKSKPGFWERLFHKPEPPVPANEHEIVTYLGFMSSDSDWVFSWIPAKRDRDWGGGLLLGDTVKHVIEGDILFGSISYKGKLVIWKNQSKPANNNSILIVLDSATTKDVSVEMSNLISTDRVLRHKPPYFWGELVFSGKSYRIFSVIEEGYYSNNPDFSQNGRGDFLGNKPEKTANNFLRDGQKFQILDTSGTVVAELLKDIYTLYDTLPETERDNLKQALALFQSFRVIAKRLL